MGWNNDYTILTGPISLVDIGRAAGYTHGKDGDDVFDGGWLIANGLFNAMAKHKAFKSSAPGYAYDKNQSTPETRSPLRVAALLAARCGFGNVPTISPSSFLTNPAKWVYNRPTQGAPNERFRPMDFDGYNVLASTPFVLDMDEQNIVGQGIMVRLLTNHRVDDAYNSQNDYQWGQNCTFGGLLMSDVSAYNYVTLFIMKTSGTGAGTINIVVLNCTTAGLLPTNPPNEDYGAEVMFTIYPNGSGSGNPAIPVLQNASDGDTFAVCACYGTIPTGSFSPTEYYKVYSGSPLPSQNWFSLNFTGANDRQSFSMMSLPNNISGSVSYVLLEATNDYWTDPNTGNYYRKYIIKAVRISVTTGVLYSSGSVSVQFTINFDGGGSQASMYGFIGYVTNNRLVPMESYSETFQLNSNETVTKHFCNETTGFTDRYFWALWDGDPDDTYQVAVTCVAKRQDFPQKWLNTGESNVVEPWK